MHISVPLIYVVHILKVQFPPILNLIPAIRYKDLINPNKKLETYERMFSSSQYAHSTNWLLKTKG